ncbi:MAG: response regulator transcription factor [Deltaproteobacteria bacterium]|nr:response regulator transcription factor [Deltaproteobacteria bacterium]
MEKDIQILLVEDEPSLLAGLLLNLQLEGYKVTAAPNGQLALSQLKKQKFDLIILDLMLPDLNGMEILTKIREKGNFTPVLILSAMDEVETKVEGLTLGADDYMTKPFELKELYARVHAILRRHNGDIRVISFGDVKVFTEERRVEKNGKTVHLTPLEYDLLVFFIKNPNRAFSREAILDNNWPPGSDATVRTVDNFIVTLRKKVDDHRRPRHFITVRGLGYRFTS